MWKWMNKRGVSPLIAAVLLIVVVVGVGAVVTGIVRNYVTSGQQTIQSKQGDIKCGSEVSISVPTVADKIRICKDAAGVQYTLDNTGSTKIDDVQIKFFSETGVGLVNSTAAGGIGVGGTAAYTVAYPAGITQANLVEMQIVPRVQVVGRADLAFCVDSALKFSPQDC